MRIYTRRGDDGTTGLLYGGRVDKSDQRTEAYGTTDEAVAASAWPGCSSPTASWPTWSCGCSGAVRGRGRAGHRVREQPQAHPGETKVTAEMVDGLEDAIDEYVARTHMPEEFIVPGESRGSAFLDYARTVIRRAERQTVAMDRAGMLTDGEVVRYLNRLADLIFVLARYEEGDFRTLRSG